MRAPICVLLLVLSSLPVNARDDGRYANSPLKPWFNGLKDKQGGSCCSNSDGVKLEDIDWDSDGTEDAFNSNYRVKVTKGWPPEMQSYIGQWIPVPKGALLEQPNRAGVAIVWPFISSYGKGQLKIRCFIPGALT